MRIALDGMGSEGSPTAEVEGALRVAGEEMGFPIQIVLVGDQSALEEELSAQGGTRSEIEIRHAPDVVEMHDHPTQALRRKKGSSLRLAFDLLAQGEVDALVSAGNTGAVLAMAVFVLPRMAGVERPALVTSLPVPSGPVALLDIGANVGCRGSALAQFAAMGAAYAEVELAVARPRVGLLSNGEEEGKGDEAIRAAHALLRGTSMEYRGVIEGRDLWNGSVDVAVCDGLVGNVLLKSSEGMAELLVREVRRELSHDLWGRMGALLLKDAFRRLKERFAYETHGGALLLGCSRPVVVAHGRSDGTAMTAALRLACRSVERGLTTRVEERLGSFQP